MDGSPPITPRRGPGLLVRLALNPAFHRLAERIPLLNRFTRAEGDEIFAMVSGFVRSQVLLGLVELEILDRLAEGPATSAFLARACLVEPARLEVLLQAGAGLRLLRQRRGIWGLTPRGAAFLAVPGLVAMVRHHRVLYGDLSDPAGFFRGGQATQLAQFWPYVFGGSAEPDLADRYSRLMTDSQGLVADDTLRMVSLRGVRHLMDIGGGTGAFLSAVARAYPKIDLTLFDLPEVVANAAPGRVTLRGGSFRSDPLPQGADAISLVRVLYDHSDATVERLLAAVCAALPPGGRLIVSEPMSGGQSPDSATDVYFSVYTLAMQTGRTRSAQTIATMMQKAGLAQITPHKPLRSFITSVVEARKP